MGYLISVFRSACGVIFHSAVFFCFVCVYFYFVIAFERSSIVIFRKCVGVCVWVWGGGSFKSSDVTNGRLKYYHYMESFATTQPLSVH